MSSIVISDHVTNYSTYISGHPLIIQLLTWYKCLKVYLNFIGHTKILLTVFRVILFSAFSTHIHFHFENRWKEKDQMKNAMNVIDIANLNLQFDCKALQTGPLREQIGLWVNFHFGPSFSIYSV